VTTKTECETPPVRSLGTTIVIAVSVHFTTLAFRPAIATSPLYVARSGPKLRPTMVNLSPHEAPVERLSELERGSNRSIIGLDAEVGVETGVPLGCGIGVDVSVGVGERVGFGVAVRVAVAVEVGVRVGGTESICIAGDVANVRLVGLPRTSAPTGITGVTVRPIAADASTGGITRGAESHVPSRGE
jgi:hypothetical protein